jgi:YegS/Rv2252/BmrU family lipid kinase
VVDEHRTIVVIANPAARGGWVARRWDQLRRKVERVLGDVAMLPTSPVSAKGAVAEAMRLGATTVASLGGDGTHSAVAHALMSLAADARPTFGIIHAGTGGDFRRSIEGATNIKSCCAIIRDWRAWPMDVGLAEFTDPKGATAGRYFINMVSVGLSADAVELVNRSHSRLPGDLLYPVAALRAYRRFAVATLEMQVDGLNRDPLEVVMAGICNGQTAGGGLRFSPGASLTDGLLDVTTIAHGGLGASLWALAALRRGTAHPLIHRTAGREVRIAARPNTSVEIDGEWVGSTPVRTTVFPGALRVHGVVASRT